MVEHCIKVSNIKKGIILDPFSGSGTSVCVAKKINLNNDDYNLSAIGIDIDEKYINFSKKRLMEINWNNQCNYKSKYISLLLDAHSHFNVNSISYKSLTIGGLELSNFPSSWIKDIKICVVKFFLFYPMLIYKMFSS